MVSEPTIFVLACIASLTLTATIRAVAPVVGLTDKPDGHRKLHTGATPLGGGLAVYLATLGTLTTLLLVPNPFRERLAQDLTGFWAIMGAAGLIVVVGLIDDRFNMSGRHKLLWQVIAAVILIASGLVIHKITLFGHTIELGLFAYPLTLFWFLGAMNALNLLDGIDGLATMLGLIISFTVSILAVITNHPAVAITAMVFSGSLLGFMWFNFPPATIFLGDAGSMQIGLMVGALAILGSFKGPGTVLLVAPLAVWAIPIFDSTAAILRRKLTGRSIYATDRGHLHHRLLDLLGSNRRVLAVIAVACAVTSVAALISVGQGNDMIALVTCGAVAGVFVVTGVFGRVELMLIGSRLRRFGSSLLLPLRNGRSTIRQTTIRLQGTRQWELLWETLTEAGEELGLNEIRLDISLPALREGFHAAWENPDDKEQENTWRVELPLTAGASAAGRLRMVGRSLGSRLWEALPPILELLAQFDERLQTLAQEQVEPAPKIPVPAGVADESELVGEPPGQPVGDAAPRHPR